MTREAAGERAPETGRTPIRDGGRATSAPWATPSSPAGRRLLLHEPPTLEGLPVLDVAEVGRPSEAVVETVADASRPAVRRAAPLAGIAAVVFALSLPLVPADAPRSPATGIPPSTSPHLARTVGTAVGRRAGAVRLGATMGLGAVAATASRDVLVTTVGSSTRST